MDLNDPRRRLQVLNNSSPSIRLATQPQQQQQISIAQPKAPNVNIVVPKTTPNPVPQAAPNTYKQIGYSNPKNKTIFGWNAAAILPKQFEKTYTIGANKDIQADPQQFLKTFDNQADDVRGAYVADLQKKSATDPVAAQTLKLLQDNGRFKGGFTDFAAGANDKLYGGLSRGFLRGVDFVLPGHNTFGLEQEANRQEAQPQYTGAGKAGEKFGSAEKGIVDLATIAAGSGAAEQAASKIPALANLVEKLQTGGKVSRVAAKALGILPGSLGGSATDVLQTAGRGDEQNVGKSFALGTAVDLGLPVLGSTIKKGFNLFKGGEASKSLGIVEDIINETKPDNIKKVLGVDNEMASYLANETNPDTVKQILADLQIDPNFKISPDVQKRLQEEGITSVKRDPNDPYAASYKDGTITARSQEDLDKNIYHEIGHRIWEKDLTPEEKALFTGQGAASKEAAGRAGYKAADVNSEDFADYMRLANSGRLNEVPENVRAVVQKYARVAAQDATAAVPNDLPQEYIDAIKEAGGTVPTKPAFTIPELSKSAKNSFENAPDGVKPGGLDRAAGEIDNGSARPIRYRTTPEGDTVIEDGRHRLEAARKAGVNDFPAEDVTAQYGNPTPNAEAAKAVEDVSKAQTGVSDGTIAGDGKTTNTEAISGDNSSTLDTNATSGGNAVKSAENSSQGVMPQKAEDIVPNADENTKKAVQEVLDNLNGAQKAYDANVPVRSAEKGARIKAGGNAFEAAGGGEAGVRAKLGALKGKYSESGFNPITASESTQKTILDDIENSNLRDFEKLNTQNAIRKIWGATEGKPTPSDINYIRKYFGEDFGNAVEEAVQKDPETWRDTAAKIAGTPRALMATADFSFGGRQGAPLGTRFPKEWGVANKESVKYAANKDYFERSMKEIRDSDAYETIKDKMHVALTAADDASMEEGFAAADYAEKIPGFGKVVSGSDRAYAGGLTKLRFDTANKIIDSYGGVDAFNKFFEGNDKAIRDLGEVINTFSGRGGKAGGLVEQHMKTLSTTLFAPRLWAAKLNSLNPAFYARLSPEARKLALQTQGAFLTTAGTVLAIASAAGATVVWDPRSADFAKIKVGNTRYDILGGLQQNIRLGAQLATGQKINSATGEKQTLGDGFTSPSRKDILIQAFESKENPLLAYASKLLEGKDAGGNPINPLTEGAKLGIPLNAQGIYETAKDRGDLKDPKNIATSTAMSIPGFFGAGVQTYGNIASKDQGKDANGKLVFKGKVTPEMVTGLDGNVILDAKGKPVTVKYPEGATDLEKQAIMDTKRKSALADAYKRTLPKEDQALMKLSDEQLKKYVKDGRIDQARYDKIQNYQKTAESQGKANDYSVPDGVKSPLATNFYKKYNSMDKKDQEAWLKQPADENSKTITGLLNKERSKGLSEFKPSNELSKAYAEYEKDLNTHPEYTEVDKRNKAKAFQTYAYKLNYSEDQRDIFSEGGSVDLKTLIDEKAISKEDLDAAIKMDNELYNSGLTGSLKFSKKFRTSYGYGLPDGGGVNKNPNGEGGSGSSKNDVNAHLLDYLPSASSSSSAPAPKFSTKRRTNGISFKNVNAPTKSTNKKISINL